MAEANTDPKTNLEKVTIEQRVKKLADVTINHASKIDKLENQIDTLYKDFEEYREKIQAIQSATTVFQEETKATFDEIKHQWKVMYTDMKRDMNAILLKLGENVEPSAPMMIEMSKLETKMEEEEGKQDSSRPFQMTTSMDDSIPRRTPQTSPYLQQADLNQRMFYPPARQLNSIKPSIIVPPSSAAPAFHGKHTESPQFLIRVQEYAESVHAWDRITLVNGISQFLRDSALERYCQLRLSHRRPNTWAEFEDVFLAQFNSSLRKARQEQEWHECKQKESETINEFLVRLRALWREQKPKETEADLVKHLFCLMRNDLLNEIGISRTASLDEVIAEVQQIEDILYRRAKGERLAKQIKQASSPDAEISPDKLYNEENTHRSTPWSNKENSYSRYKRRTKAHQVNEVTPSYYTHNQNQTISEPNMIRQVAWFGCYNCEDYGHWTRDCPRSNGAYRQEQSKPNTKNVRGALDERTSHAPM
jgi:citrate synthase